MLESYVVLGAYMFLLLIIGIASYQIGFAVGFRESKKIDDKILEKRRKR